MDALRIPDVRLAAQGTASAPRKSDTPERIHEAAQQFEALLMQQLLRAVRDGGGWLGTGEDSTGECASDFAEQQFACALSSQGGLGLAELINKGLAQKHGN